jgi:hypothetical protein
MTFAVSSPQGQIGSWTFAAMFGLRPAWSSLVANDSSGDATPPTQATCPAGPWRSFAVRAVPVRVCVAPHLDEGDGRAVRLDRQLPGVAPAQDVLGLEGLHATSEPRGRGRVHRTAV